jgi:hypothetical protein
MYGSSLWHMLRTDLVRITVALVRSFQSMVKYLVTYRGLPILHRGRSTGTSFLDGVLSRLFYCEYSIIFLFIFNYLREIFI